MDIGNFLLISCDYFQILVYKAFYWNRLNSGISFRPGNGDAYQHTFYYHVKITNNTFFYSVCLIQS